MPSVQETFIIRGGRKLKGRIEVSGAKNAAFPVLMATLLTTEECTLHNVPLIGDVRAMLEILKSIGVEYRFLSEHTLKIRAKRLTIGQVRHDLVEQIRASILLCGALPSRARQFTIYKPGGCSIGARILDPHKDALLRLGISIKQKGKYLHITKRSVPGKERDIVLSEMSVTATENAVLASVLANGVTRIHCAATEPYVQDLCHMLNAMGAKISGVGTNNLSVTGVRKLRGVSHTIMPDPIEMGTFIALAAATRSHITIANCVPEFIAFELLKFKEAHVTVQMKNIRTPKEGWRYRLADITVVPSELRAVKKVHNAPYPGLSPDVLPMFAMLATQAKGVTLIHDWMYEGRLKYIEELRRMGADAFVCDPHRALITGPTPLEGKEITSFDLRAGAVLIIAALAAKGKSVIHGVYQVDRGYERIVERLRGIGAHITRVK